MFEILELKRRKRERERKRARARKEERVVVFVFIVLLSVCACPSLCFFSFVLRALFLSRVLFVRVLWAELCAVFGSVYNHLF